MMKQLFFTFLLAFLAGSCLGQFRVELYKTPIPKGKIDSVVTTEFFPGYGKDSNTSYLIRRLTEKYSRKKRLVESNERIYGQLPESATDYRPVRLTYIYDATGNLIESRKYYTTGDLCVKISYLKKGLMVVAKDTAYPNKGWVNIDSLKIDLNGRIIECDSYTSGVGLSMKSYIQYDKTGRLIEENIYGPDGFLRDIHSCKYDDDGNIIEDKNPFGDGEVHTFTYDKYDKMHNWLKRTEYVNRGGHYIQERVIAYY